MESPTDGQGATSGAPTGYRFDLSGGRLCLDFANTVDGRAGPEPEDHLGDYVDLVAWAEQAGVLKSDQAGSLIRLAGQRPVDAATILERARRVREAIYVVFSNIAGGVRPDPEALAVINAALPAAMTHLRLTGGGECCAWTWTDELALDRMLWEVLYSTARLLTADDLKRVRECASETCAWLFLDQSRNRSRRWCDMSVCGNRSKVRRHYHRSRVQGSTEQG